MAQKNFPNTKKYSEQLWTDRFTGKLTLTRKKQKMFKKIIAFLEILPIKKNSHMVENVSSQEKKNCVKVTKKS